MHEELKRATVHAHTVQGHDVGLLLERCPQTLVGFTQTWMFYTTTVAISDRSNCHTSLLARAWQFDSTVS